MSWIWAIWATEKATEIAEGVNFEPLYETAIDLAPTVLIITITIALIKTFLKHLLNYLISSEENDNKNNTISENTIENKEIKKPKTNIKKIKNQLAGMDNFKESNETIKAKRNKLIELIEKGE